MLAKVAVIESTESTENWRTAHSGAAEVHSACYKVAIIEYTESTENWRTALSGAAEVATQCLLRLQ